MSKSNPSGAGPSGDVFITAEQFATLMETITATQAKMDSKLESFGEQIRRSQEEVAVKAVKRAKTGLEKPYEFKKKGNEEQAYFNSRLEEKIQEAQAELEEKATPAVVEKAKSHLKEGLKLIAERQKLIKLADRSEFGWGVVVEYTADELADDSGDEKKIEKAEKAAEKKAAKRKKSMSQKTPAAKQRMLQAAVQSPVSLTPQIQTPGPSRRPMVAPGSLVKNPRSIGPCFQCGEMGHLRVYCPKAEVGGKKLYPLQYACTCVKGDDVSKCDGCVGEDEDRCDGFEDVYDVNCNSVDDRFVEGRVWEVEAVSASECYDMSVQGRLKKNAQFWREVLKAPESVLSVIESGYVLPLKSEPTPIVQGNQQSAFNNADFVQQCLVELISNRCVRQVDHVPYICSPLSVVENSSNKKRLVINLRHLNKFLWKQKFKYEDLRIAMLLFEKGDYLFSFDLKSGYHHVDIALVHQKYLGFSWAGSYYLFTVLPFGLSTACYIFTKLLRPLVKYWRGQGIRIVVYLDDGIGAASGETNSVNSSAVVRDTLEQAGFCVNQKKSVWKPVQRLKWLGFVIDLACGQIEIPQEKIERLIATLTQVVNESVLPAKVLASVLGRIISMSPAIGPISRFMTRSLYKILESRTMWCEMLTLSVEAGHELEFWLGNLKDYKSQPIWFSPSALRVVYSDASDTGYGGYVVEHGYHSTYGQWLPDESRQSSTWRELSAVLRVLQAFASKLSNMSVRWFSDNQNVVHILQVGSRQPQLQEIALKIFNVSIKSQIRLQPEWVPRELNEQADFLSRIIDLDDWMLNPVVFGQLDAIWGPHTVDRFADFENTQLPRFNSRCWNPDSEGIDAFTVNWGGDEYNWWCPPIALVPRVIRHAQVCSARGTLVVPHWPSAPYWPILCPHEGQFEAYVIDVIELPLVCELFLPGRSGAVLFNGGVPNTKVLALCCDFTIV